MDQHGQLVERTRWAEWLHSALMSYDLMIIDSKSLQLQQIDCGWMLARNTGTRDHLEWQGAICRGREPSSYHLPTAYLTLFYPAVFSVSATSIPTSWPRLQMLWRDL